MKKTIIAIFVISALIVAAALIFQLVLTRNAGRTDAEIWQQDGGVVYYQPLDRSYSLVLMDSPNLEFSFVKEGATSLRDLAREKNWLAAINGGYFHGSSASATPVGLLQLRGQVISNLVNDSQNQATHILIWDANQKLINFVNTRDFSASDYAGSQFSLMQAGPLFLRDNVIQTKAINNSINGAGKYLRSAIGITKEREIFFVVSRYSVSLQELADLLKKSPILKDTSITVLNLDGGSSTALYSSKLEALNFGEAKRLPVTIGLNK